MVEAVVSGEPFVTKLASNGRVQSENFVSFKTAFSNFYSVGKSTFSWCHEIT
jgi:hypothetical protein